MQVCFFSILLKCKVLIPIEFKTGVSVLQSLCSLEIFGNVFIASRIFLCKLWHNGHNGNASCPLL